MPRQVIGDGETGSEQQADDQFHDDGHRQHQFGHAFHITQAERVRLCL
jgi:hypothetical protein